MDPIKTDKLTLKKFGFLMAAVLLLAGLIVFIKHRRVYLPAAVTALLFFTTAIFIPVSLKYFYIFWIKLARCLSWVNTRILLGLMFYGIFTPLGLFLRLFRIDLLERKFDRASDSYWKSRMGKKIPPTDYHRQS
jgi:hypothetical protein